MIRGLPILMIGTADWDAPLWTNQQHLASRLAAAGNDIVFVESLGLRRPRAGRRDVARLARRLVRGLRRSRPAGERIRVVSPLVLPLHGFAPVRALNERILLWTIRAELRRSSFRHPVLWAFSPGAAPLVGRLGERLVLYHCVDEYAAVPGIPSAVASFERSLLARADLVVTTSRALYESKRQQNARRTVYEPNVADAEHFARARDPRTPRAAEMAGLPRPVLGFVGALDDYKVDAAIIEALAGAFPLGTIVLIGPLGLADAGTACASVTRLPNVRWLGPRPYAKVPEYMASFDACLIPYRMNDYTRGVFPMKFYEALATGKPVVATRLPSLAGMEHVARLVLGPAAFVDAVRASLAEETPEKAALRVAESDRNSWSARLESLSERVQEALFEREARGHATRSAI